MDLIDLPAAVKLVPGPGWQLVLLSSLNGFSSTVLAIEFDFTVNAKLPSLQLVIYSVLLIITCSQPRKKNTFFLLRLSVHRD